MAAGSNKVFSALQLIKKLVNSTGREKSLNYIPMVNDICKAVSAINKEDVNFNDETMMVISSKRAPVTYIHIYDDQTSVASSIFALKEGSSLPLHDHPNMHGFIKCISGKLLLTSYSKIWEKSFHENNTKGNAELRSSGDYSRKRLRVGANKQPDKILTEHDSETAALQPEQGNIHTITAIDGPAAFIDFLAPPYSDGSQHTCHYFQIESSDHVNDIHTLLEISCPPWYWCADAPYIGPQIPVS